MEISDNENIYESLEEFILLKGGNPKLLDFKGRSKEDKYEYISINFRETLIRFYASDKKMFLNLSYKVEKLIEKRKRRWIYKIFNSRFAVSCLTFYIFICFVYAVYNFLKNNSFKNDYFSLYICFLYFLIYLISEINPNSNTKVELKRRHETNFYLANKDKIILTVLASLFGYLLKVLFDYFKS